MLDAIKALISSYGDVYVGSMPNSPDNVIALFMTGGFPRDLAGEMIREPTFQVRVRATSYPTGIGTCVNIQDALHGVNNSGDFLLIAQQGDINDIGRDENNRPEFTMNFRAYYR